MGLFFPRRSVVVFFFLGFLLLLGALVGLALPLSDAAAGVRESVTKVVDEVVESASDKLDSAIIGVEEVVVQLGEDKGAVHAAGAKGPALTAVQTMKNNVLGGAFAKKKHAAAQLMGDAVESLWMKSAKDRKGAPAAVLKEFLMVKEHAKQPLLSAVLTAAKDMAQDVEERKKTDVGDVGSAGAVVQEVAQKLDRLLDQAEPVVDELATHYDEVVEEVQDVMESVQEAAAETVEETSQVVDEVVQEAAEAVEGVAEEVHEAVEDVLQTEHAPPSPEAPAPAPSPEALARRRLFVAERLQQTTGVSVDDAVKAVSEMAALASEGDRQIRNSAVNVGKAVLSSVSETAADGLKAKVKGAADLVQKVASHATHGVPMTPQMDTVAPGIIVGATDKIVGVNNKISDAAVAATTDVINQAAKLKTKYNDGRAELNDSVNEAVASVVLDIAEKQKPKKTSAGIDAVALHVVPSDHPAFLVAPGSLSEVGPAVMATLQQEEEELANLVAQAADIDNKIEAATAVLDSAADVADAIHENFIVPVKQEAERKKTSIFSILNSHDRKKPSGSEEQDNDDDDDVDGATLVSALTDLVGHPAEDWFNKLSHEHEGQGEQGEEANSVPAAMPSQKRRMLATLFAKKSSKKDALMKKLREAKEWKKESAKKLIALIPLKKISAVIPEAGNLLAKKNKSILSSQKGLLGGKSSDAIETLENLLKKKGVMEHDEWLPLDHLEYIPVVDRF